MKTLNFITQRIAQSLRVLTVYRKEAFHFRCLYFVINVPVNRFSLFIDFTEASVSTKYEKHS